VLVDEAQLGPLLVDAGSDRDDLPRLRVGVADAVELRRGRVQARVAVGLGQAGQEVAVQRLAVDRAQLGLGLGRQGRAQQLGALLQHGVERPVEVDSRQAGPARGW
jgi:hypothetical protein